MNENFHFHLKIDYCQLLLIKMVNVILMFESARLYLIITFVTRLLVLTIGAFFVIWLPQGQP